MDCRGGGSCRGASQRRIDAIHWIRRRPSMDLIMAFTPKEIRDFQASHRDWTGAPLLLDGDVGPKTAWSLAVAALEPERAVAVGRAVAHYGLMEDPPASNSDPRGLIAGWLGRCGVGPGKYWCAAWLSWVLSVPGSPEVKIAGAVRLGSKFPAVPAGAPVQAGDVFWFPTDTDGSGHCELVVGVSPDQSLLATIGGNVRNGVQGNTRRRSEGEVSRPFAGPLGAIVPLPLTPAGELVWSVTAAHRVGTR